jgi:CPA1 family monovalent cation:H+ antiporter
VRRLSHEERGLLWLAIVLVGVILAVRVLWAVPLSGRSGWRTATALTWAGTRGVLPLVAVLTVPVVTDGVPFPHRDLLVALTAGVTLLTLVVQGLTLALLLRRLSFVPPRR